MHRVVEIEITPNYSEFVIERKILWFWITVPVDERHLASASEANRWIRLQERGFPTRKYHYD